MTSQAIEGACAFAWRNYLLLHSNISENDSRRSALYRYVTNLRDTGEGDFDLLQIAAVTYLKKLDELHDDRGARLAADQAVKRTVNAETGKYFQLLAAPDYAGFPAEGCTSIPPNHSRVYAARCLSDCSSTSRGSRTITKRAWKKPRPLVGRVFRVTTCASQHLGRSGQ